MVLQDLVRFFQVVAVNLSDLGRRMLIIRDKRSQTKGFLGILQRLLGIDEYEVLEFRIRILAYLSCFPILRC